MYLHNHNILNFKFLTQIYYSLFRKKKVLCTNKNTPIKYLDYVFEYIFFFNAFKIGFEYKKKNILILLFLYISRLNIDIIKIFCSKSIYSLHLYNF